MINAWLSLWKNTFNYTGKTAAKEYWLGLVFNVIVMYILVIPVALICRALADFIEPFFTLVIVLYLLIMHLPVLAAYFRRMHDVCFHPVTKLLITLCAPIIGGLFVGICKSRTERPKGKNPYFPYVVCMVIGFALFIYGGFFGILLFEAVDALAPMVYCGLLLAAGALIVFAIRYFLFRGRYETAQPQAQHVCKDTINYPEGCTIDYESMWKVSKLAHLNFASVSGQNGTHAGFSVCYLPQVHQVVKRSYGYHPQHGNNITYEYIAIPAEITDFEQICTYARSVQPSWFIKM